MLKLVIILGAVIAVAWGADPGKDTVDKQFGEAQTKFKEFEEKLEEWYGAIIDATNTSMEAMSDIVKTAAEESAEVLETLQINSQVRGKCVLQLKNVTDYAKNRRNEVTKKIENVIWDRDDAISDVRKKYNVAKISYTNYNDANSQSDDYESDDTAPTAKPPTVQEVLDKLEAFDTTNIINDLNNDIAELGNANYADDELNNLQGDIDMLKQEISLCGT